MRYFKEFMVSADFSTQISINSLASGAPPMNPLDMHITLFSYIIGTISTKNSIKFFKILKKFQNFH